ncbi:MAG: DUF2147 domain-containing protein [Pseudomonadota bacterium]
MMRALGIGIFVGLICAQTALADPVHGTWQSPKNEDGASLQVTLSACGTEVCGVITKVLNSNPAVQGRRMIWGMKSGGNGSYTGGRVWAPDEDKTYRGKLELSGGTLKVSGCVLGGAICRGSTFRRVN